MPKEKQKGIGKFIINAIWIIILVNIFLFWLFIGQEDPVVARARPYFSEIDTDNAFLENKATSAISECSSRNEECQINEIYRYVVENYEYLKDPLGKERIRPPEETINKKYGDCEDFAILLNSLLGNIGIKTYLVLTEDHAYSLACDINLEDLQEEIIESFRTEESLIEETISLEKYQAYYYGWDGEKTEQNIILKYNINSDGAVDIRLVPSRKSLKDWVDGESYEYYPSCSKDNIYRTSGECTLNVYGGILIINEGRGEAKIDVKLGIEYLALDLEEFFTHAYEIEGEDCVVLDATGGEYSYPGYSGEIEEEKIAIDPVTEEYWVLE